MKKFIFKVLVCTGATFTAVGTGYNVDAAMMDACYHMAEYGDYPEDDIMDVELVNAEEEQA